MWSETSVGDWAAVGDADLTEPALRARVASLHQDGRIVGKAMAGRGVVSGVSQVRVRCVRGPCPAPFLCSAPGHLHTSGAAMHLSDTLVFGPLGPLLPQPVRVRLVALLVGLVGGLGILTLAGLVLVLGPAALPASARSL